MGHPRAVIALDDQGTWPREVRKLIEANRDVLRAYEAERKVIDAQGRSNILARLRPAQNHYAVPRAFVLRELTGHLADTWLVGYHCTRLEEDEIRSIIGDGLQPLTLDLVERRVKQRLAAGSFLPSVGERLLGRNSACGEYRQNQIWFILHRAAARGRRRCSPPGVVGGEAVYRHHEEDVEVGEILRKLGTACIVEAEVTSDAILPQTPVGELLLRRYLHEDGVELDEPVDYEGYVTESTGVAVRRIVKRADAEFERLTGCSTWKRQLT